jgi:recombination protein RecT
MTTGNAQVAKRPIELLKQQLGAASVREQFTNALQENTNLFVASVIDLFGSSPELQQCDPNRVIAECLKAATLKLPLNRSLGFAWVIPYKVRGVMTPQFQIGYKGYIQLALRTGQYRYINAGVIFEGIEVNRDILTGMVAFSGNPTSEKAQGYFAYLESLNGFKKTLYMTKAEVERHGQRYSKAYNYDSSPWKTDFDGMAMKTCLRMLLSKFGYMSIDTLAQALNKALESEAEEEEIQSDINANANKEVLPQSGGGDGGGGEPIAQGQGQTPVPNLAASTPKCFRVK